MGEMSKKQISLKSLGTKIFIAILLFTIIPLTALGGASYYKTYNVLMDKFRRDSMESNLLLNDSIDNYFNSMQRQVNMMATNINFTDIQTNPEHTPFLNYMLENIKSSNEDLKSVYFGASDKKFYLYPKTELPADFDPTSRPWYKDALNNKGKSVVSEVYIDTGTKKPVISISRAVEKNGQIVGVVAVDIDLNKMSDKISSKQIGKLGYIAITNSSGIVIAHKDKSLIGTDSMLKLDLWKSVSQNKEGFSEYKYNNELKYAAFSTNELTRWKVIAIIPKSELIDDTNSIRNITLIMVLLSTAVASIISLLFSKRISNNIKKLKESIKKAAEGDFSDRVSIDSKDEIGELAEDFNSMKENVSRLLEDAGDSSKEVLDSAGTLANMTEQTAQAIGQIALTVEEIARGTLEQAKSSEEGSQEINQLAERIGIITNSTKDMEKVSIEANDLGNKGLDIITILNVKSKDTEKATDQVSEIVGAVNESTKKISSITETIAQITEQTNLLALNAAIEAARAGEAGKGFSVVAEEIRMLAEQSMDSAREIDSIIKEIQGKSKLAVEAMNKTEEVVESQKRVVKEAEEVFNKIILSIGSLSNKVKETKNSTTEMNANKQSVVAQIYNISAVSEETAASTEEVSASVEEVNANIESYLNYAVRLKELSEHLKEEIDKFKLN
ncbi:methyl-accepting chemotaxis protein [Clostridium sp. PL3]|uniref:Methyl-accepting chemotaxis protein n=1 Tax=Clostridium thailandense TaxID=2794346 RepID=A0A949TVW5_9CLOT|nr:methyl-accepting chemotaxis protein [Clostridium thailandense]MBV7272425.1 methyl-accepting chemotaxis protein [Clostridium thailandense]